VNGTALTLEAFAPGEPGKPERLDRVTLTARSATRAR
jgi:hypothetical protein